MAPTKVDQGAIIILDVGKNVSCSDEKAEKTFFEEARECTSRLIERKIISQGKNLVGIVLLGSKKTKNNMAEEVEGAFRHIEMFSELVTPTWDLIRNLPDTPSQSKGDWVDAIIVAADHFSSQEKANIKIKNKKIILMTNFKVPTKNEAKDVQLVLDGLNEASYEVDVIGPDIFDEMAKGDLHMAQQFVETTNGATATFEYTIRYLLFHKKKSISGSPWNVDLSIGPNIKIPVSAYIRIRDDTVVKSWKKAIKDPITNKSSTEEAVVKKKVFVNMENQTTLDEENEPIKGYHYGQRVIPFTEFDKSMLYKSGDKCLSIYGFTDASNVNWQNLTGDGLQYIFGRKGDQKAQEAIRCLLECLHELKLVGIARRVYNNNNAPKMFVIMPVLDPNNYICLSMATLCFKEDIKYMSFPPTRLKKYNCTDEQVKGFVDLIKAMDLMKAYDDTFDDAEALPIGETVSPFAQHMLDCIVFRAMHPNEPLPQPRDDIMKLFKLPPLIEKRAKEPMEKLKSLFELVKVEKITRKRKNQFLPELSIIEAPKGNEELGNLDEQMKVELPVLPKSEIKRICTLNPIEDYTTLKVNGKSLADLAQEMTSALESMINGNLDGNYTKAFDAMLFFRKECVDSNPSYYNEWLQIFKETLNYRKKHDILVMISEKNANYILKTENSLSKFDADGHNESQLYENDTVPDTIELSLQTEEEIFANF